MQKTLRGFTLVEIAIVLVIIGLLIGGILAGQALIKNSELRSIYAEKERLQSGINTFKIKYNCLPGDCEKATQFFGQNPNGCPPPVDSPPGKETCNGNGDGTLRSSGGVSESYLIWQHLSAADFWPGLFRGVNGSSGLDYTFPRIGQSNNYWYLEHGSTGGWSGYELYGFGHFIQKHLLVSYTGNYGPPQLLTPEEGMYLDTKYDDGRPAFGNIQAMNDWQLVGCTNPESAPAPEAVYDLTKKDKNCNIVILDTGF